MDSERIKEIKDALGKGGWDHLDDFPDNIIRGLLTHIDTMGLELAEAKAEIERLQSAYSAANELIGQMAAQKMKDELLMRAEFILNKNLVKNLSQTIQERDKAERELEARRQGRFYD